jgi:hypothetical protein
MTEVVPTSAQPRLSHPAAPEAGHAEALRLHLPFEEVVGFGEGEGAHATRGSTDQPLSVLLHRLNPVLRGWTNYFRHGVSKATFCYLRAFLWRRVICWLRHKHPRASWKKLRRNYLSGWWRADGDVVLFNPSAVAVSRHRYRANRVPTPWVTMTEKDVA